MDEPDDFTFVESHVLEPLVMRIEAHHPTPEFEALSRGQKMLLAMWHVEGEVSNGGFFQFYFNIGPWLAPYAAEGYEAIGAPRHAAMVRRSIAIVEEELRLPWPKIEVPEAIDESAKASHIYKQIETSSRLPALDGLWHALDRDCDLHALKAAFIRAHPDEFPTPSPVDTRSDFDQWAAVVGPIIDRFDSHQRTAAFDALTPSERMFAAMWILESQVFNGGFHQFYFNRCGYLGPFALAGYEAIGAFDHKAIVRGVLDMMARDPWAGPRNTWPDPEADDPVGALDIGDFDERWYALPTVTLDRLKVEYIRAHPGEFTMPQRRG